MDRKTGLRNFGFMFSIRSLKLLNRKSKLWENLDIYNR